MRCVIACAVIAVAACADGTPTNLTTRSTSLTAAPVIAAASGTAPTVFNVQLLAENEPNGSSTSTSKGPAQVVVHADGSMEFLFAINNKSDETYTRAHIHKAPAGSNGPIHWDFLEAGDPVASVSGQPALLRGVARARAAAVLADLLANPDQYYVNVHSTAFPGGAVRGQLR